MTTAGRFTKLGKLGEGSFGAVYKARDLESGGIVALKRMNISGEEDGVPATTIREIALLQELRHDAIIHLRDVLFRPPKLTLIFDCCDFDLKKYMEAHPKLDPETETKHFLRQLLQGVAFMHDRDVVHRDLKPHNLLINEDRGLKIADFGLARVEGIPVKKYSHDAVTLWYRSPDVILGTANYGLGIDMWAVGCIFAEMAMGHPLFAGRSDEDQLLRIFKLFGTPSQADWPDLTGFPKYKEIMSKETFATKYAPTFTNFVALSEGLQAIGPDGVELLRAMLRFNPKHRITAADALRHRFFQATAPASSLP